MAEFWNSHSLAAYWDQTEPAEFEISKDVRRRYLVPVDSRESQVLAKLMRPGLIQLSITVFSISNNTC